jgi:predicted  nucleic acid-binding Zn-ribbon protein
MLSRNNWLPFAAVLVVAALFYAVVEARLSTLAVLDTKMASLELRLGAMERAASRGEARLELETQKLENKLELTEGRLTLLGTRLTDLDKNIEYVSTKIGSEEQTSKPGSIADRLDSLEGGLGTVSQVVTTLRQDSVGRAEASDTAQSRILEQLAELRKIQEAEMVSTRQVVDLKGELAQVREQSEKTSADLRLAVDEVRKEISGALEDIKKVPADGSSDEAEDGLAALTRGSEEAAPVFEVRASDVKTGMVVLSRGAKAGIKPGTLFSVARDGEHIAFVKVVRVWDDYSGAEVIEVLAGHSVQSRDLVTAVPEKESAEAPAKESPGTTGELKLEPEKKVPPPPPAPLPGD